MSFSRLLFFFKWILKLKVSCTTTCIFGLYKIEIIRSIPSAVTVSHEPSYDARILSDRAKPRKKDRIKRKYKIFLCPKCSFAIFSCRIKRLLAIGFDRWKGSMIASMRDRVIKGYKYKIFYTSAIWLCLRFVQEFRTRHCPRVIVRKIAGWRYPVPKRAALSWFYNGINIVVNGCKNWPIAIKYEKINSLWLDNSYNYNHLRLYYCRIFTLCLFEISHFEFLRRETIIRSSLTVRSSQLHQWFVNFCECLIIDCWWQIESSCVQQ